MKTKFQDLLVGAATRHARACLDETLPQVADSADFQSLIIGNLKKALTEIKQLDVIKDNTKFLRVEE